jgi:hypothetical protein
MPNSGFTASSPTSWGLSRSGLFHKKPKELLPLPPRQRLQQRPHQSLDLYLTVFFRPGSRIRAQSRYFISMTMTAKDKLRQTVEETLRG